MKMERYTVRFVTPAFLGDAEQKGAWRTPPFKASLREWWRIVKAKEYKCDHQLIRKQEGLLFGHAWLATEKGSGTWAMKSHVLLRFNHWSEGALSKWQENEPRVFHPEVGEKGQKVGAHLYLGYGPLVYDRNSRRTSLKASPVIQSDEHAELAIGMPEEQSETINSTLQLMHWFGSIGSRSRNGWGSFVLEGKAIEDFDLLQKGNILINNVARPIEDCLHLDWPHALGLDAENRPLVWRSKVIRNSWSDVIGELATIKIEFRKALEFTRSPRVDKRHVLAYPVTHHSVAEWSKDRLANQLRFKVANRRSEYFAIIYHLPSKLPERLLNAIRSPEDRAWVRKNERLVWQEVHSTLDKHSALIRI
jgi:CRISPR-associated protein Cmr1